MHPSELVAKRFHTELFGYHRGEVRAFLRRVADELDRRERRLAQVKATKDELATALASWQDRRPPGDGRAVGAGAGDVRPCRGHGSRKTRSGERATVLAVEGAEAVRS